MVNNMIDHVLKNYTGKVRIRKVMVCPGCEDVVRYCVMCNKPINKHDKIICSIGDTMEYDGHVHKKCYDKERRINEKD